MDAENADAQVIALSAFAFYAFGDRSKVYGVKCRLMPCCDAPIVRRSQFHGVSMGRAAKDERHLTHKVIDAIEPQAKRLTIHDASCANLLLVVQPTGTKSWYWLGTVLGKTEKMFLGKYPAMPLVLARKEAQRLTGEQAAGHVPKVRRPHKRTQQTFGGVYHQWLELKAKRHNREWKRSEQTYEAHLSDWKSKPLDRISKLDVLKRYEEKCEIAIGTGRRVLTLIRSVFRWAEEYLEYDRNPASRIRSKRYDRRTRFLNSEEVAAFFDAVMQLKRETTRDFFLFLIYTGQRRGNVESARWDEIDLVSRIWTIPGSKFKGKRPHLVPLPDAAVDLLERRKAASTSEWVFPSQGKSGHLVYEKAAVNRIRELSGLKDIRLHDLRRTFGTWQRATGADLTLVGKVLGHQSPSTTSIYAQVDPKQARESMQKTVDAIRDAIENRKK